MSEKIKGEQKNKRIKELFWEEGVKNKEMYAL